jgi:protein phosphatase
MKAYTITDVGKVRSENQDGVYFFQDTLSGFGVLALCDGMGGAKAGSVASGVALDAFTERILELLLKKKKNDKVSDLVIKAVEFANSRVYSLSELNVDYSGMGTTIVAAVINPRQCCIANVGDSRAYILSGSKMTQITNDHSFVEDMVKRGSITREQAKNHPRRNIITRALGVEAAVECDLFTPNFKTDDILLLCSDGLSNTLTDGEILEIVAKRKSLEDIGKNLLDLALSRGAPDNVTIGLLQK